jgi:hypothetical protein
VESGDCARSDEESVAARSAAETATARREEKRVMDGGSGRASVLLQQSS